jgi:hypothetical protein
MMDLDGLTLFPAHPARPIGPNSTFAATSAVLIVAFLLPRLLTFYMKQKKGQAL